jgi:peroxiredoxin Q/BCP
MATTAAIKTGDKAPDFTLPAGDGRSVTLSELYADKTVVLYFYPKDETAGCTAESCAFRDSYQDFQDAGAVVVGVSNDSVESHRGFAAHHSLPFTLLSDAGGRVRQLYGVKSTLGIIPGRVTFIIDRRGVVRYAFSSQVRVYEHVKRALETVRSISGEAPSAQP